MITVAQLIEQLSKLPQDLPVEVNDNGGGNVYPVDSVDLFNDMDVELCEDDGDYPVVILQVNC